MKEVLLFLGWWRHVTVTVYFGDERRFRQVGAEREREMALRVEIHGQNARPLLGEHDRQVERGRGLGATPFVVCDGGGFQGFSSEKTIT
jgi:hypothetical protein